MTEFEGELQRLFQQPSRPGPDTALTEAVMARLAVAERRRNLVLAGAACVGGLIAAAAVASSGVLAQVDKAADAVRPSVLSLEHIDYSSLTLWPVLAVGLVLTVIAGARAARDA